MRLDDFFNDSNDGDLEEKVEENIILKSFQVEALLNMLAKHFQPTEALDPSISSIFRTSRRLRKRILIYLGKIYRLAG